jgi:hypothetical protein
MEASAAAALEAPHYSEAHVMGGDELRSLEAWQLAAMLAGALRDTSHAGDYCQERITYYLDTKRYGETAAVAMSQARDAAKDGNFSTAQHLEAIEKVLKNSGAPRGSRLSVWELAQHARKTNASLVYDSCDLMTLVRRAEDAHGITRDQTTWLDDWSH